MKIYKSILIILVSLVSPTISLQGMSKKIKAIKAIIAQRHYNNTIKKPVISYKLKKSVRATHMYQKFYFKALGIDEARWNEIQPECLFLNGLFYLIDKKTEEPGRKNVMQNIQGELDFMVNWLQKIDHYTEPMERNLKKEIEFFEKEQIYVQRSPNLEELHDIWKLKTSDIRMLGCMVSKYFTGLDEPAQEIRTIIDEMWRFGEAVMDVRDLKKDVEQNALNIYKFYCRLYGSEVGKKELWNELQRSKSEALDLIAKVTNKKTKQNLISAGNLWWLQLKELPDMIHDPHYNGKW